MTGPACGWMPDGHARPAWNAAGPPASTPLDQDDTEGLIPSWVATRADLNNVEQRNILQGLDRRRWARPRLEVVLDDLTVRALHRDIFGGVWRWAGAYRQRETSIGVDPRLIATSVRDLMDDARLWVTGDRPMPVNEAGCRLHHRLVLIHPFPNGNGRHGRAMTDLLLNAVGATPFTWGRVNLDGPGDTRDAYIAALRAADAHDLDPLLKFVRS